MSKTAATGDFKFILEADLKYPVHLHESHNGYPLAAENVKIKHDMLSPYSQSLINKHSSTENLAPNLNNKMKYIVHYENLRFYLELGLKLFKVHRILQFSQSASIKPYIDFSTTKRKEVTSSFLQNLFKLFINSVFGKTLNAFQIELTWN